MKNYDTLIFELSVKGRKGYTLPASKVPSVRLPAHLLRKEKPELPEVNELGVLRHFTNMSFKNYGIETNMYPLGSCTMKYNPKIHQDIAAGAHGELVGLMVMKKYHEDQGNTQKMNVLVPDAAHGTNPASAILAGFNVVEISSNLDGTVNMEDFYAKLDENTAGIMLTNPNTIGVFERNILEISKAIHDVGGLLYYDGANLNPLLGIARPGDMGFDIMHINLPSPPHTAAAVQAPVRLVWRRIWRNIYRRPESKKSMTRIPLIGL